MFNPLERLLGEKEGFSPRLTLMGWIVVLGILWATIGFGILIAFRLPDVLVFFDSMSFDNKVITLFIAPGVFVSIVTILVWFMDIGFMVEYVEVEEKTDG